MKKILSTFLFLSMILMSIGNVQAYRTASYHKYITGPKGGCFYKNSHGNKTYVARSKCK